MTTALALMLLSATGRPVAVDTVGVRTAISASIEGCEKWVLEPTTWVDSVESFPLKAGLNNLLVKQEQIPDAVMPPPAMRRANHHWYVAGGKDQGIFLTTSDTAPFCHIAGGGPSDFQPAVEAYLADPAFLAKWRKLDSTINGDMISDRFENKETNALKMIVSRASKPDQRTDRVQFLATAQFATRN